MTAVKNHIKIVGYGTHLPRNTVTFKDQTRYRVVENEETQLSMAVKFTIFSYYFRQYRCYRIPNVRGVYSGDGLL